jgi:LmbE family N-acetylglucosaminyl deacetylase
VSATEQIGIPESAVCLFAHPDDPEFMAGGTIAAWTDAGCRVSYVIMTDGRAGVQGLGDTPITDDELIRMRQEEQRAAGAKLGVEDIVFLDHGDGLLFHTPELRRELVREIRRIRPQAAILFDPQRRVMQGYVQHPDHWTSGEAALASIFPLAGNRRTFMDMFDEGLMPHQITDIYLCAAVAPNLRIDVTSTIDRKIDAMRCHHSQVADPERLDEMMRTMTRMAAGDTAMTYAEQYHFLRIGARDLALDPIS